MAIKKCKIVNFDKKEIFDPHDIGIPSNDIDMMTDETFAFLFFSLIAKRWHGDNIKAVSAHGNLGYDADFTESELYYGNGLKDISGELKQYLENTGLVDYVNLTTCGEPEWDARFNGIEFLNWDTTPFHKDDEIVVKVYDRPLGLQRYRMHNFEQHSLSEVFDTEKYGRKEDFTLANAVISRLFNDRIVTFDVKIVP